MFHKFLGTSQSLFIDNFLIVQDDGILEGTAECKPSCLEIFDILQKPEGSRRTDLLFIIHIRKCHVIGLLSDNGMFEINFIGDFEF